MPTTTTTPTTTSTSCPPVTNPPIVDNTTVCNATFTANVDVGYRHDITFKDSTFQQGINSANCCTAHNITIQDSVITNPGGICVKMGALDSNWSFLRVKIHDCGSSGVIWNRQSSTPPNTQWGTGFSFIAGEVWNTGLSDQEHAFYLDVHDVHVAGTRFHDYARSAISLRYGGALVEFNDFVEGPRSFQDAISYYEYDCCAYGTVEIHRNLASGVNQSGTDMWIGTSEGPNISKNWQTFNVTDNCMTHGVARDSSLNPGPYLTVSNNARCTDSGAAFWTG